MRLRAEAYRPQHNSSLDLGSPFDGIGRGANNLQFITKIRQAMPRNLPETSDPSGPDRGEVPDCHQDGRSRPG